MDREALRLLHGECTDSLQVWIQEAIRTCELLGECANPPLSLERRAALQEQRARENAAQNLHMELRQRLFELARTGLTRNDLVYGTFPE